MTKTMNWKPKRRINLQDYQNKYRNYLVECALDDCFCIDTIETFDEWLDTELEREEEINDGQPIEVLFHPEIKKLIQKQARIDTYETF